MVDKNIIAVIPARGGSKRIPKKNIIELGGKPMIAWTIEAALNSKFISSVIVSTDDEEIASEARKFGAEVPFLRVNNADDHSPISLATVSTLSQLRDSGHPNPDIVVQLMANCPMRGSLEIDDALENFLNKKNDFQISCFKYGWMNPWWAHQMKEDGTASPIFKDDQRMKRSQDLPDLYCPTGAIWIAKTSELHKTHTFYGPGYSFYPMNWLKALDIDDYDDLEMAERLINL